jgi:hypothetical protein
MEEEINKLLNGNMYFLNSMTNKEKEALILEIRDHSKREEIAKILLDVKQYTFAFNIIYDDPNFLNEVIILLNRYSYIYLDKDKFDRFIKTSKEALDYVLNNLDLFLKDDAENIIASLVDYLILNKQDLNILLKNPNLHNRALTILYVLNTYPMTFETTIISAFPNCLKSENELISEEDLSKIINSVLENYGDIALFKQLKEFLLSNYPSNHLAEELLEKNDDNGFEEFKKDADRLFLSSKTFQIQIMKKYSSLVTKDIMDNYKTSFKVFLSDDKFGNDFPFLNAVYYGLSKEIKRCVDTYLDLSVDKTCEKIGSGTTSDVYRIGDYVIKLVQTKWSMEDIICPNLYLIAKDYENILIRNDKGLVLAGLEVQKHLSRKLEENNKFLANKFLTALKAEGYYLNDSLSGGTFGDNAYYLDSYTDADTSEPESLPEWFKLKPVVLVDRDRVYKLSNTKPKERSEFFS